MAELRARTVELRAGMAELRARAIELRTAAVESRGRAVRPRAGAVEAGGRLVEACRGTARRGTIQPRGRPVEPSGVRCGTALPSASWRGQIWLVRTGADGPAASQTTAGPARIGPPGISPPAIGRAATCRLRLLRSWPPADIAEPVEIVVVTATIPLTGTFRLGDGLSSDLAPGLVILGIGPPVRLPLRPSAAHKVCEPLTLARRDQYIMRQIRAPPPQDRPGWSSPETQNQLTLGNDTTTT
jgi:hypothetical protein